MSTTLDTATSVHRARHWRRWLAWCFLSGHLLACHSSAEPPPPEVTQPAMDVSYLTPRYLSEAIDKLITTLPKPVRLLSLTALNRVVVIQAQDPKDLSSVSEYRFADGQVTGPVKVELRGPGKLNDNLFRVGTLDPHVAEKVLMEVRTEYSEEVRKLVLTRNLPVSMDIQFRVFLKTQSGDRVIIADKYGRLLGPLTPGPGPNDSPAPPQ